MTDMPCVGDSPLTRMPYRPQSKAMLRIRPITPALPAQYGPKPGYELCAPADTVTTMLPPPCRFIWRQACLAARNTPV